MDRWKSFARFSIRKSFTAFQFLHWWTAPMPLNVPSALLPSSVVSAKWNVSMCTYLSYINLVLPYRCIKLLDELYKAVSLIIRANLKEHKSYHIQYSEPCESMFDWVLCFVREIGRKLWCSPGECKSSNIVSSLKALTIQCNWCITEAWKISDCWVSLLMRTLGAKLYCRG